MNPSRGLSKSDRASIGAAFLLMMLSLIAFLFFDQLNSMIRPKSGTAVGVVDSLHRDVRYKVHGSIDWDRAQPQQPVDVGDAIFCGEGSSATVRLFGDKKISVGERSMVKFIRLDGWNLANLDSGTFDVRVEGEVRLAIHGEPVILRGGDAVAHIYYDDQDEALVRADNGAVQMEPLGSSHAISQSIDDGQVASLFRVFPPVNLHVENAPYVWKVPDFYTSKEKALARRDSPATEVASETLLTWSGGGRRAIVQHASDPTLKYHLRMINAEGGALKLDTAFVGENDWRVAAGSNNWSMVERFDVEPQFLLGPPTFSVAEERVQMVGPLLTHSLGWKGRSEFANYILERSENPAFPANATHVDWVNTSTAQLFFNEPGDFYYRLRGVDGEAHITELSGVYHLQVTTPALLKAPLIPLGPLTFFIGNPTPGSLTWAADGNVSHFRVDVFRGYKKIESRITPRSELALGPMPKGHYSFRVLAYDRFNRPGHRSDSREFWIASPEMPTASALSPLAKNQKVKKPRDPANSVNEESIPMPQASAPNDSYNGNYFRFEAGLVDLISSVQAVAGEAGALLASATLGITHWWQNYGVDGSIESMVFKLNSAPGETSYTDAQVEVMRRWKVGWNWFSFLKELQISAIAGFEYFNSAGSANYSPGYQLIKAGMGLDFPIAKHWDTGGQATYGIGFDSSEKLELSGHIDYWIKSQWSLGLGYRAYFFQAGATGTTPDGLLPYREAWGESYTVLRYHY